MQTVGLAWSLYTLRKRLPKLRSLSASVLLSRYFFCGVEDRLRLIKPRRSAWGNICGLVLIDVLLVLWYQWVMRCMELGLELPTGPMEDMRGVLIAEGLAFLCFFENAKYYSAAGRQCFSNGDWRHLHRFRRYQSVDLSCLCKSEVASNVQSAR